MLALTLLRPWDAAILHLGKNVENRKWHPAASVRGQRIALHAGKGYDGDGAAFILAQGPKDDAEYQKWIDRIAATDATAGHIVGTARIVDWWQHGELRPATNRWAFGPWCWDLADVRALSEPVPCKGALSLWRLPPAVEALVIAQDANPALAERPHAG